MVDRASRPPRRVLFVAGFAPPWGGVGALRLTKLLKYLPARWRAVLVTSDATNPEISDPTLLADLPPTLQIIRIHNPLGGGGSLSAAATRAWRTGRFRRVIGWAKGVVAALLIPDRWLPWSLRAGRLAGDRLDPVNVVVSSGPPHSGHLAGARIAGRLGVPFVMDMRDDWYDNPMNRSRAPWHGPLQRRLERWAVERAAQVVVISDDAIAKLEARHPRVRGRVVCIPNGFDPDDLPATVPPPSKNSSLVLAFVGTLRREQETGEFFRAFAAWAARQEHSPRLRFRGIVDRDVLGQAEAAGTLPWLTVHPPVEHRRAIIEMAEADVLLVFTGGGGGRAATMTGKLFEYLAVRRPILLVGPAGPAARLVAESGAGAVARDDDEAGIRQALDAVMSMARDTAFSGAPDELLARFNRRAQAETWGSLLDAVVERAKPSSQEPPST